MIKKGTASVISIFLNPVFATFAALVVALGATQTPQRWSWLLVLAILNLMVPMAIAAMLIKKGFAIDDTLANRRVKRERLYMLGALFFIGLMEWYLAARMRVGQPFVAAVAATTLLTGITSLISYSWKISLHLSNIAALVVIAAMTLGITTLWLAALVPVTVWSRRVLDRHTIRQMVAGTLIAPAVILPIFYLYGLL